MTREEYLQPLLAAVGGKDASVFDGWEVVPGFIDGEHAATAIIKGTEIHFALVPRFVRTAVLKGRTQEFLRPMFERKGFLTTRVAVTAATQKKFVERIGFKPTWSDSHFQYYLLGKLPFARS